MPEAMLGLIDAQSIVMLPMVIRDKVIGMFLAARGSDQPKIGNQDIRDLRTLANHAVLAIHQSLSRR